MRAGRLVAASRIWPRIGIERRAVERRRQQRAVAVDDVGAHRRRRRRPAAAAGDMRLGRGAGRSARSRRGAARRRERPPRTAPPRRAAGCGRSRARVGGASSATTGAHGGGGLKCRGRQGFSSRRWADSIISALAAICANSASSDACAPAFASCSRRVRHAHGGAPGSTASATAIAVRQAVGPAARRGCAGGDAPAGTRRAAAGPGAGRRGCDGGGLRLDRDVGRRRGGGAAGCRRCCCCSCFGGDRRQRRETPVQLGEPLRLVQIGPFGGQDADLPAARRRSACAPGSARPRGSAPRT